MKRLLGLAFIATGCVSDLSPRHCASDGDCLSGGVSGTCLASPSSSEKWCAFPSSTCASGTAWGVFAGDKLASTCVDPASAIDGGKHDGPIAPAADAPGTPDGGGMPADAPAGNAPDAGVPILMPDPTSIGFGMVTTGSTPSTPLTIMNTGGAATGTLTTRFDGTDASLFTKTQDGCTGHTAAAGASCSMMIVFSPTTIGEKSASVTIGSGAASVTIQLGGTAVLPGALMISSATFPSLHLPGSNTATVTVTNTGGAQVTGLSTGVTGTNSADFTLNPDGCNGKTLQGGGMCSITIKFAPSSPGTKSASLSVSSSAGNASTPLSATASATLSVTLDGMGHGTVTSTPSGISCTSGTCTHDFTTSSIMLTADPDASSAFTAWSGCAGTGSSCTASLGTTTTAVHATFQDLITVFVTITDTDGAGTVTTSPPGITCRTGTCSAAFARGTMLRVTATPGSNSLFGGWYGGGVCSPPLADDRYTQAMIQLAFTNPCVFTVSPENVDIAEQATFSGKSHIVLTPQGSGTVTSIPAGMNCPPTCTADLPYATIIAFLASPSAIWTANGACNHATKFCWFGNVSNRDFSMAAQFGFFAVDLDIEALTAGAAGRVVSTPAGIDCDTTSGCRFQEFNFSVGTPVTLTATPAQGSSFVSFKQFIPTDETTCMNTQTCTITNFDHYSIEADFQSP